MRSSFLPLALLASSCVEIPRTPGVMFSSAPPGARVVVDGRDSGFVTPCHLDLERKHHDVDIVLPGYTPAAVKIEPGGQTWLILWDEAWLSENVWHFPLWLNARDGLFPVKVERSYEPKRVYVQLRLVEGQDRPRRGERERGERAKTEEK